MKKTIEIEYHHPYFTLYCTPWGCGGVALHIVLHTMGELHIMVHTMGELHIMLHSMGQLHIASAEKLYNWRPVKMQLAAKAGRVKHIFAISMEVR